MAGETDKNTESNDKLRRARHADSFAKTSLVYDDRAEECGRHGRDIGHAPLQGVAALANELIWRLCGCKSI